MYKNYIKPFSPVKSFRTWSLGLNAGVLTPYTIFGGPQDFKTHQEQVGYGAYIKKQFLPSFALQTDFFGGTIQGKNASSDVGTQPPFYRYSTEIKWSASLSANITLFNISWRNRQSYIQPYLTFGGGAIAYSPTVYDQSGLFTTFKPDGKPYYTEMFIPVGTGLKFDVGPNINIDLGYRVNFVDADNVDGYKYGLTNDKFSYLHFGFEIIFGKLSKPQLAMHNPVASMRTEYTTEIKKLKIQVDGSKSELQAKLQQLTDYQGKADSLKQHLDALQKISDELKKQVAQQKLTDDTLKAALNKLTIDSDHDGVADIFDRCPGTALGIKVDGSGCPFPESKEKTAVTEEDKSIVREAIADLQFDTGKATIREQSYTSLDKLAQLLMVKNLNLRLSGYTDNTGSAIANLRLSKNRAVAIKSYLISKGANPAHIESIGYGKARPVATNKTQTGRQQNRRVEFTLY